MSIEKSLFNSVEDKVSKGSLYPERASFGVETQIDKLQELESGELKKAELSEDEKKEILDFENSLGERLLEGKNIETFSGTFYSDYFVTEKGKKEFREIAGFDVEGETAQEVSSFLEEKRSELGKINSENIKKLCEDSRKYVDESLARSLANQIGENGELNISNVVIPTKTSLLLTPENALKKILSLRSFKKELKEIAVKLEENENDSSDFLKAKAGILELYRRKVNEMIAESYYFSSLVLNLHDNFGGNGLSKEEKELLDFFGEKQQAERNYSRFDKFIHGASNEYDEQGMKRQVGSELLSFVEKLEGDYIENELTKNEQVRSRGLDPEKIFKKNISSDVFSGWANEVLELYGQKSQYPPSDYKITRAGAAPDDKWQFVARSDFGGMEVKLDQKVIKSPTEDKSIFDTITKLLAHEIEGHFVQGMNSSRVGLRLLSEIKGDRLSLFSEGGAVFIQNKVSQSAFGVKGLPLPHYIRAMAKKSEGGNFLDCIKAYHDSSMKLIRAKKDKSLISDEEFTKEAKSKIKTAIGSSRRLFKIGSSLDSDSGMLSRSRDTVYVEQVLLMDKLEKARMTKYAFIGGANLDMLIILAENGLLDLDKIEWPKMYSLEYWERVKNNYVAKSETSTTI